MFTTRLRQPAPHYCGLGRKGTSRKAAWQGCVMSNVAAKGLFFGRSSALEVSLLDSTAIAQRNPEAHP
jgi:hypothetical protein